MLYALLVLVLLSLLSYVTWRWLRLVTREGLGAMRTAVRVARGSTTPGMLVEATRERFERQGLSPDMIIVSHGVEHYLHRLRRQTDQPDSTGVLPAALAVAVGISVDPPRLYLHCVTPGRSGPARELRRFHAFDEIRRVELIDSPFRGGLGPPGEHAVAFHLAALPDGPVLLVVEPAWRLTADELLDRLLAMIKRGERPAGAAVFLR